MMSCNCPFALAWVWRLTTGVQLYSASAARRTPSNAIPIMHSTAPTRGPKRPSSGMISSSTEWRCGRDEQAFPPRLNQLNQLPQREQAPPPGHHSGHDIGHDDCGHNGGQPSNGISDSTLAIG